MEWIKAKRTREPVWSLWFFQRVLHAWCNDTEVFQVYIYTNFSRNLYFATNLGISNPEQDLPLHLTNKKQVQEEEHEKAQSQEAKRRDFRKDEEEINDENEKEKETDEEDEEDEDDDDDNKGGGLLIPVIKWIGGMIPRLAGSGSGAK